MRTIWIVGTEPRHRRVGGYGAERFRAYLVGLCRQRPYAVIAEETSREALQRFGSPASICQEVASTLGLEHLPCDPSAQEQKALGIWLDPWLKEDLRAEGRPALDVEIQVDAAWGRREVVWIERLLTLDRWPALFVCDRCHVHRFRSLAHLHGCEARVLNADVHWT